MMFQKLLILCTLAACARSTDSSPDSSPKGPFSPGDQVKLLNSWVSLPTGWKSTIKDGYATFHKYDKKSGKCIAITNELPPESHLYKKGNKLTIQSVSQCKEKHVPVGWLKVMDPMTGKIWYQNETKTKTFERPQWDCPFIDQDLIDARAAAKDKWKTPEHYEEAMKLCPGCCGGGWQAKAKHTTTGKIMDVNAASPVELWVDPSEAEGAARHGRGPPHDARAQAAHQRISGAATSFLGTPRRLTASELLARHRLTNPYRDSPVLVRLLEEIRQAQRA